MYESADSIADSIGACHFLETMAFKSTASRTSEEVQRFTMEHGISTGAVFNREVLMYKVDCLRSDVSDSIALLGEAVLAPRLSDAELDEARRVIAFQRDEALSQPQLWVARRRGCARARARARGRGEAARRRQGPYRRAAQAPPPPLRRPS